MIVLIFYISLLGWLLLTRKYDTILYFPLIGVIWRIAAIPINPTGDVYHRELIVLQFVELLSIIIISLFIMSKKGRLLKGNNFGVLIFSFVMLILISNSSNIWFSTKRVIGVISYVFMFFGAYLQVKNKKQINILIRNGIIIIVLFEIDIIISSILKIGLTQLSGQIIRHGGFRFFDLYALVYNLILLPVFFQKYIKFKNGIIILYFIGFIMLFATTKRSFVLLLLIGLYYFIKYLNKQRGYGKLNIIRITIIVLVLFFASFSFIKPLVSYSYKGRIGYFERNIEDVSDYGRIVEITSFPQAVRNNKNPKQMLFFGTELFNSLGKFKVFKYRIKDDNRLLHADYTAILYGAGIVGLFLYFRIFYLIFIKYKTIKKFSNLTNEYRIYVVTLGILILTLFLNGFFDGLMNPISRIVPFLYIGALLGFLENKLIKEKWKTKNY